MRSVRALLVAGNDKLGQSIVHFDLPAVKTCPGRTPACTRVCYARHGWFVTRAVKDRLAWCYRQSLRKDFAERLVAEVRRKGALVVRMHVSGDLYSAAYARKWLEVMRCCPQVIFYLYTRSWRLPYIEPVLHEMAEEENVRLWYSTDADTGVPEQVPQGVRLAYMQDTEIEPIRADLVFRIKAMRAKPRLGLPMICPQETNKDVNCGNCQHCWR